MLIVFPPKQYLPVCLVSQSHQKAEELRVLTTRNLLPPRLRLYPQAEANRVEVVGTHLGPGPVPKLLAVAHGEHGLVLPAVEGRPGTLQDGLLLRAQAGGQHSQQGHHAQHACHF